MPILEVLGGTRDVNATLDYCMKDKIIDPETKRELNKCVLKAGVNCDIADIHSDFQETRDFFEKDNGRKGMHFTASFSPKELSPYSSTDQDKCLKIGMELANKISKDYESGVFVHVDQDHLHCHIVTNSVNYKTGKKYHMEKDKDLVIIRNQFDKICKENGLDPLDTYKGHTIGEKSAEKRIKERGKVPWKQEIKEAIGYAKEIAVSFEEYKELLLEKGVEYYERGEKTKGYIHLETQEKGNSKCKIRDRNKFLDNGYHLEDVMKQIKANKQPSNSFNQHNQPSSLSEQKTAVSVQNIPSMSFPIPTSDSFEKTITDNINKKADIKEDTSHKLEQAEDELERMVIKKKEAIELEQAEVDKEIKLKDNEFYEEMIAFFRKTEGSATHTRKKYKEEDGKAVLHLEDIRQKCYRFTYTKDEVDTFSAEKLEDDNHTWTTTDFEFIEEKKDLKKVKEVIEDVVSDSELQYERYQRARRMSFER